jgi:hypothetical protein
MTARKRIEITVETDRVWLIRRSCVTHRWCAECGREVNTVRRNEVGSHRCCPALEIDGNGQPSNKNSQNRRM